MTFSVLFLQVLIFGALIFCALSGLALLVMLAIDFKDKTIW